MKLYDLIDLCFRNLTRRKVRTLLTVIGVVVGTCAIVVMVSLGIGMKQIQEEALAQMGDLKRIQVYNYNTGSDTIIDDAMVQKWKKLEGVVLATPMYENWELNLVFTAGSNGKYRTSGSVTGVYPEALKELGFELLEGSYFLEGNKDTIPIVVGEKWGYNFYNTRASDSASYVDESKLDDKGNPPPPFVNVQKDKIEGVIRSSTSDKELKKKVLVCGRLKEDFSKGYQTSRGVFLDIKEVKKLEEEARRMNKEKKKKDTGYQNVFIKVEDIKYIEDVEKVIKADGFETSSLESIRKPMEAQARQQQAVLGGLGAISLFVAAIGITNTMIMSIYERTREIGVMKALGCYVKDVRTIFLLEAGTIGFLGGVIGIIISFGLSYVINRFGISIGGGGEMGMGEGMAMASGNTSVIPIWLVLLALVFSTLIGLISGYYPANRAVKISALEAIRGE